MGDAENRETQKILEKWNRRDPEKFREMESFCLI